MIALLWLISIAVCVLQIRMVFLRKSKLLQRKQRFSHRCDRRKETIRDTKSAIANVDRTVQNLEKNVLMLRELYKIFKNLSWETITLFPHKNAFLKNKIWNIFQCRSVRCLVLDEHGFSKFAPVHVIDLRPTEEEFSFQKINRLVKEEDRNICRYFAKNPCREIVIFETWNRKLINQMGVNKKLSSFVVIPLIFQNRAEGLMVFENIDPHDLEKARIFSSQFLLILKKRHHKKTPLGQIPSTLSDRKPLPL